MGVTGSQHRNSGLPGYPTHPGSLPLPSVPLFAIYGVDGQDLGPRQLFQWQTEQSGRHPVGFGNEVCRVTLGWGDPELSGPLVLVETSCEFADEKRNAQARTAEALNRGTVAAFSSGFLALQTLSRLTGAPVTTAALDDLSATTRQLPGPGWTSVGVQVEGRPRPGFLRSFRDDVWAAAVPLGIGHELAVMGKDLSINDVQLVQVPVREALRHPSD